jgi:hypothetical protein
VLGEVDDEMSKIEFVEPITARKGSTYRQGAAAPDMSSLMSDHNRLKLKFEQRSTSVINRPRDNILAVPKPEYHGKDFF